jgi:hypothetical protein
MDPQIARARCVQKEILLEREIYGYYEAGLESGRLEASFSRWEKVRTLDLLDRHLPPAPAVILDVGGAAGAYAFPLAGMGYVVDLFDPVPLHIEQAQQHAAMQPHKPRTVQLGDARAIPCEDLAADAVLFFGPLVTTAFFHHPDELKSELERHRLVTLA